MYKKVLILIGGDYLFLLNDSQKYFVLYFYYSKIQVKMKIV